MKTTPWLLLSAIVLTFGLSPLRADSNPLGAANDTTAPALKQAVTGPVTNVDPVNQTIQVKDLTGSVQTFAVNPDVTITRNDQMAKLEDIKVGDVVTIKVKAQDLHS